MFLAPLKDKYFENIILENILYVKIAGEIFRNIIQYCRTHNVCLYIAYIACGSAVLLSSYCTGAVSGGYRR